MVGALIRIGVLGPSGSHSDEALNLLLTQQIDANLSQKTQVVTEASIRQLIVALENNTVEAVFVPVENTLEGSVREVLDALSFQFDEPTILLEYPHLVKHRLIRKQNNLKGVQKIISHPQAIAQCREPLVALLGNEIEFVPSSSTSQAVQSLLDLDDEYAAIGTQKAAELNALNVVADDICHLGENITRFLLLGFNNQFLKIKNKSLFTPKTSLCVGLQKNTSGALLAILQVLSAFNLNMTKIESRPAKTRLGEYVFYLDFEGEAPFGFYENLLAVSGFVKKLGVYPAFQYQFEEVALN